MRFLFILLLLASTPAFAESQTYNSITGTEIVNDAEKTIKATAPADAGTIVPNKINVSLVSLGKSDQVGLRFSVPDVVNGCWDISPLRYTSSAQGPYYFDVEIMDYTRRQGSCGGGDHMARATVPLDKKLLKEGMVKVLRLSVGTTTDKFNVTYKKGIVRILPQTQTIFTAGELTYNFDKGGKDKGALVALIVPSAPARSDTTQALADFAMTYGLTATPEEATSSLAQVNGGSAIHYYYDAQKTLGGRLGAEFAPVGEASIPMIYDTDDGRGQTFVSAPVYGKKVD